jgi:hypothetical protein
VEPENTATSLLLAATATSTAYEAMIKGVPQSSRDYLNIDILRLRILEMPKSEDLSGSCSTDTFTWYPSRNVPRIVEQHLRLQKVYALSPNDSDNETILTLMLLRKSLIEEAKKPTVEDEHVTIFVSTTGNLPKIPLGTGLQTCQ